MCLSLAVGGYKCKLYYNILFSTKKQSNIKIITWLYSLK